MLMKAKKHHASGGWGGFGNKGLYVLQGLLLFVCQVANVKAKSWTSLIPSNFTTESPSLLLLDNYNNNPFSAMWEMAKIECKLNDWEDKFLQCKSFFKPYYVLNIMYTLWAWLSENKKLSSISPVLTVVTSRFYFSKKLPFHLEYQNDIYL